MTLVAKFFPATPEILMVVMIIVIMLVDLLLSDRTRVVTYVLSQLTLLGCAALSWVLLYHQPTIIFSSQFVLDYFAGLVKLFVYLMGFLVLLYSRAYATEHKIMRGEFHLLILLSILGAMVLLSANSMLTLYLGLELMSLPLYALVAMRRDAKRGAEAAMKYFVMGALASGLLLYGMSIIYGITHTTEIPLIMQALPQTSSHPILLRYSMVFVIAAIAFKFGAAPFHMWVPDVYEGAPTAVTAFLGTVPKLAALALFIRLVADGLVSLAPYWTSLLLILAILSLLVGNILAIVQTNLKRMLAYSTIANIGFVLLSLSSGDKLGYSYALFYSLTYVLMAVGAFGLLTLLSRKGHDVEMIQDLAGLNTRHSWLAAMMMLILLSMAGIPPLIGFDAKLLIVAHMVSLHHYVLAVFALIISVVGAYYYLYVVKVMYFDAPPKQPMTVSITRDGFTVLSINGVLMLLLGVYPVWLLSLCHMAF